MPWRKEHLYLCAVVTLVAAVSGALASPPQSGGASLSSGFAAGSTPAHTNADAEKDHSVNRRGRHVFDVKSYGAVGDGAHDDTNAINMALAAAKKAHGILYFPPGTYDYRSPLNLTELGGLTMQGAGPQGGSIGLGVPGTDLNYTGPPLGNTAAAEFTNSNSVFIKDIAFSSAVPVAAQLLFAVS